MTLTPEEQKIIDELQVGHLALHGAAVALSADTYSDAACAVLEAALARHRRNLAAVRGRLMTIALEGFKPGSQQ